MKFLSAILATVILISGCASSENNATDSNDSKSTPKSELDSDYQNIPEPEQQFMMFDYQAEQCWKREYLNSDYLEPADCWNADYEVVNRGQCGYKQDGFEYVTIDIGFTTYCLKSKNYMAGDQYNYNILPGEVYQGHYIHMFGPCPQYALDDFVDYYDILIDGRPYCARR